MVSVGRDSVQRLSYLLRLQILVHIARHILDQQLCSSHWHQAIWQVSLARKNRFRVLFSRLFYSYTNIALFAYRTIKPTDHPLCAIMTLGEGWHNYHHVFPWDYKTAELGNYRYNMTTGFIDFFAKIGKYELPRWQTTVFAPTHKMTIVNLNSFSIGRLGIRSQIGIRWSCTKTHGTHWWRQLQIQQNQTGKSYFGWCCARIDWRRESCVGLGWCRHGSRYQEFGHNYQQDGISVCVSPYRAIRRRQKHKI